MHRQAGWFGIWRRGASERNRGAVHSQKPNKLVLLTATEKWCCWWWCLFQAIELAELLQPMLAWDPAERPTAAELLRNPYFKRLEEGDLIS